MAKQPSPTDADGWTRNAGTRPRTGEQKLLVRLECRNRDDVEQTQQPQPAKWWKRWSITGCPTDIAEWKRA